ncbi:hypothetical protein PLESTM_000375500 [Pleodorina starrii]|nr:hypothetical protein PLESTM_000375500 [Pleodorina starrii]
MATAAANWNLLSDMAQVPDMSPEMVVLADLQLNTEFMVVVELNKVLEGQGFPRVNYISDAVYRIRDKAFSKEYRDELKNLLVDFFGKIMSSDEAGAAVVQEWPTVMEWRSQRAAFTHPLGVTLGKTNDAQRLASLKAAVSTSDAYRDVRAAASLLLKVADSLPKK